MAKTTVVKMTDDIDGSAAAKTVTFGLDGVTWEIDLSKKNALALEQLLEPYISAGRRVRSSAGHRRAAVSGGRRIAAKLDAATIRTWAAGNGFEVSGRGRIAASIIEAYKAAN
jgi:hypothetical protein